VVTRKELEDVLNQMNAIFERIERKIEELEKQLDKPKSVGRPKKTA
jgi:chromosome segregation ATPase